MTLSQTAAVIRRLKAGVVRDDGAVTVEFVVVVPFLLTLFFASVDAGITMLRQVMLDRATDLAVREVRLGRIPAGGSTTMAELICDRSALLPDCADAITVEMQPVDTTTFAGLDDPVQCVNREEDITPAVTFDPGMGGQAQELMVLRICVAADPFIRLTGMAAGMPVNANGEHVFVSRSVFVNEPD